MLVIFLKEWEPKLLCAAECKAARAWDVAPFRAFWPIQIALHPLGRAHGNNGLLVSPSVSRLVCSETVSCLTPFTSAEQFYRVPNLEPNLDLAIAL